MGAMVGCEILNEASNGTTRWGSGMDRLAHTRPAPRKDHIQCDLTNQQSTHQPEENFTTIFLSLLWTWPTLIRMMVKLARLERLLWSGRSLEDPPLHRDCRCSQKRWGNAKKILTTPLGGTVKRPVKFYAFELYELETTSGTPLSFSIWNLFK